MKRKQITKKMLQKFVRTKLSTDYRWATKALIKIYDRQTDDEKNSDQTRHENGIGFSGCDAEILSSFAKQHLRGWNLSKKQRAILYRKMQKYSNQIISMSDKEKLNVLAKQYYKSIGFQETI